jgi:hypothetical protein
MEGVLVERVIKLCLDECKKKNNKQVLETVVLNPTIDFILCKIKPYLLITCVFFIVMIVLIISIIVLLSLYMFSTK